MRELIKRIDAVSSLGITLESADAREAVVAIPLAGNSNDKGSFFAGSLYSAMVLAGWCLAMENCAGRGGRWEVVIKDSQVSFKRPAASNCRVVARPQKPAEVGDEDRLALSTVVEALDSRSRCCALFRGEYRGFRKEPAKE